MITGPVLEREHLHLLDEAPPDDEVVAVEAACERLAVQDLLADEVGEEPVRLRGGGRPAPLPGEMLVEPLALGRGHHDVVARPRGAVEPERDLLVLGLVVVMSHGSCSSSSGVSSGGDRDASGLDRGEVGRVVAGVLTSAYVSAKSAMAPSNVSLVPRYAAIATASPLRACARASAQPQSPP